MSEARLARIEGKLDELEEDMSEIKQAMAKQRGFVAGFSAAFTMLWAALVGLGIYIWKHISGNP